MKNSLAKHLLLVSCILLCLTPPTGAASVADVRAAYDATLKCAVANGNAERERRDAGDADGAARYDANAKRSFDGAYKLGEALGLTDKRIGHELDDATDRELPRMVSDRSYFLDAVATCKGLGLM